MFVLTEDYIKIIVSLSEINFPIFGHLNHSLVSDQPGGTGFTDLHLAAGFDRTSPENFLDPYISSAFKFRVVNSAAVNNDVPGTG